MVPSYKHIVMLSGIPGVGKTYLCDNFMSYVQSSVCSNKQYIADAIPCANISSTPFYHFQPATEDYGSDIYMETIRFDDFEIDQALWNEASYENGREAALQYLQSRLLWIPTTVDSSIRNETPVLHIILIDDLLHLKSMRKQLKKWIHNVYIRSHKEDMRNQTEQYEYVYHLTTVYVAVSSVHIALERNQQRIAQMSAVPRSQGGVHKLKGAIVSGDTIQRLFAEYEVGDSNVPDEDCIKVLNNGVVLNAEDMFATFITLRESYDCIWRRVKTYYEQYLVQYYRGLHAGESTLSSHSYSSKQLHVEFLNRRISEETLAAEANKNREINSISFVNRCDLCMKQVVAVTIKYFLNRLANVNGLGNPMWESDCGVVREYIHKARKHAITKLREYSAHIKNNEQTMIATFPLIHQLHMALGSKKENDFEVLSLVYRLVIDLMLRSEPSVKSTGIETRFMNEYWQEISEALMHSRT